MAVMVWTRCPDRMLIAWVATHASACRLSADQVQLVAGTVDQHHPGATVGRVALLGLVEHRRDDLLAADGDRAGQPLRLGLGADPAAALAAWALGGGGGDTDDIMGAAGSRGGVVDHPQGGHPLACLLLATGQPRPVGASALGLGRP